MRGLKPQALADHCSRQSSHPTWVRGLKLPHAQYGDESAVSHPTWVRGLKRLKHLLDINIAKSHPTWVRGLKQKNQSLSDTKS